MDKQPQPQPQPQPQEQERHERGAEAKLLCLSLLIRVGAVAALVLCFLLAQQFDSSAQLLALTLDPQNRHGLVAGPLSWLTAFVRWDTVYFLSIANPDSIGALGLPKGGYAFEQMHAFQPAVPLLLRAAGYVSPDLEWSPTSAVILVTLLANVATLLAPVLLYRLTLRHTGNHDIAWKAAVLSTICPSAGTTLSSPTPEPFFSLVSLAGMLLLAPTRLKSGTLTDTTFSRRFQAGLCFAAATSFRANGVLLAGFLIWDLFWTRRQSPAFALRILEASVHVPLAVSPFVVSQVWAHMRFCVPGQERPWCTSLVPSVYAFVQEHYWDVGFLRYWTLSQLPNFVLAAPVLVLLASELRAFVHRTPVLAVLTPWVAAPAGVGGGTQTPHMVLSAVVLATLLFGSHVQIALRFATPGGMPVLWWAAGRSRSSSSWALAYLAIWMPVSTVLYAGFYPPA